MGRTIDLDLAVNALQQEMKLHPCGSGEWFVLSSCLGKLVDLPSAQPESCDDAVSRQGAIDAVEHIVSCRSVCINSDEYHGMKRMQKQAVIELMNLPSVQSDGANINANSMISRQVAIGTIKHMKDVCDTYDINDYYNLLIEAFSVMPSVQPEIIRCKECEHWDKSWTNDWEPNCYYCPMIDRVCGENWYCAGAERRTDE